MSLDAGTLVTALVVVCSVLAALFALSWVQNRTLPAFRLWTLSFMLCAAAAACVGLRGLLPGHLALDVANTLRLAAFGLAWQGTRHFAKRQGSWPLVFAPAILWVAACALFPADADIRARVLLSAPISAACALAIAWELWQTAPRRVGMATLAAVLLAVHGAFFVGRFFLVLLVPGTVTAAGIGVAAPLHPIVLVETLGAAVALAFVLISLTKEAISQQHRDEALLDPLTGVANRRGFSDAVVGMLSRSGRSGSWTALILIDLDRFKAVNDGWGHPAGDRLLKTLTETAMQFLRPGEVMGRLGGDEFAVALPDCRIDQALVLAERIRRAVATSKVDEAGVEVPFTVSLGTASLRGAGSLDQLLAEADTALYRAKAAGGNQVAFTLGRRAGLASDTAPKAVRRVA